MENKSCETQVDTSFYLRSNPELSVCKFIREEMAWSWSPGDHWLAGSLPGLLGTYPGQGPRIQDSWISISPNRFRGLWDAVGGLFLRIRSLLPTEQLAAGQGWLRNLSVTAKLSFTALRVWIWGGSHRARQAPAVRGVGGHPQKALGSSHHISCSVLLCFTGQCYKARS